MLQSLSASTTSGRLCEPYESQISKDFVHAKKGLRFLKQMLIHFNAQATFIEPLGATITATFRGSLRAGTFLSPFKIIIAFSACPSAAHQASLWT